MQKIGDARIGLVGFPSVGKSSLLTALTGVQSEAAAYERGALDTAFFRCLLSGFKRYKMILMILR